MLSKFIATIRMAKPISDIEPVEIIARVEELWEIITTKKQAQGKKISKRSTNDFPSNCPQPWWIWPLVHRLPSHRLILTLDSVQFIPSFFFLATFVTILQLCYWSSMIRSSRFYFIPICFRITSFNEWVTFTTSWMISFSSIDLTVISSPLETTVLVYSSKPLELTVHCNWQCYSL